MKRFRTHGLLLAIILLFLVVLAAGALIAQQGLYQAVNEFGGVLDLDSPASNNATAVHFTVRPGDTASMIADRLEAQGLVRSAVAFRILARSKGVESKLAAGEYELRANMRPSEILNLMLQRGENSGITVTFPEGWRMEEMADRLEARGVVSRTDFLRAARVGSYNYSFLAGLPAGSSLEGYLFPDTYTFSRNVTATAVVDTMLRNFDRRFDVSMRQQAEREGKSIAEVVTIASIVEREAVVPEERPMIAEVFLNRLALKMPLQADPTVQYAVANADPEQARRDGYWKQNLGANDLKIDSPYNTYENRGLPPGAICNPGLASLKAVLAPTSTGYLYFVAKPGGTHAFARTLEEHNQNVAKYRDSRSAR